jgi:A/G-specific adenine glycosylase
VTGAATSDHPSDMPAAASLPDPDHLAALVYAHYREHGRRFSWRDTYDPYAILVSEIMLQQTQVDRVREKYASFLRLFPDFPALARAELGEVLSAWQWLGYNRRAVALHRCAREVVARYDGSLPASIPELVALPGIGPYTARAVAAFAFGIATPFIETNIRSVYIHHFFADRCGVTDREILPLVALTLDAASPRDWYYALMDYGAMLKKSHGNPGRKSAHHARQSPFHGSNRQRRSLLLKRILAEPGVTEKELTEMLGAGWENAGRILLQMEREGFLRQDEGRYFIR